MTREKRMCGALNTGDFGRGPQYQCVRGIWHDGPHMFIRKPLDRAWWWPRLVYRLIGRFA